jgi:hypothetical protein
MVDTAINNMTDEELDALIAELARGGGEKKEEAPVVETPTPAQPTAEEIARQVAAQMPPAQVASQTAQPVTAPPAFDQKKYAELFINDAGAAQEYLETVKYGMPLSKMLPGLMQVVATQNQQLQELNTYRAAASVPDYAKHKTVVDQLVKERGWSPSPQSYQDALDIARSRNMLPVDEAAPVAPTRSNAPPRLPASRSGGGDKTTLDSMIANARNLTDEQLDELAFKAGIIKHLPSR